MADALGAERLERAMQNPGRFVLGPTSLSIPFPYGGVPLGPHDECEIVWHASYINARDPFTGRIVEIGRNDADFPELYCLLRGVNWDEDTVRAIFFRATRPAASPGDVRINGTQDPSGVKAWPPLLFAADDPTRKSAYVRRPVPTLSLRESVALSLEMRTGLPVRFVPTPDRDGPAQGIPDFQVCKLEHMTL